MRVAEARCVWPASALLGEAPVWIAETAALYWVDIFGGALHRYSPADERRERCVMPSPTTALAPMADGRLLCSSYRAIHALDTASGELATIASLDDLPEGARINDGAAHADGSFWFGSMDRGEHAPIGDFHRLAPDGTRERIAAGFAITNGPAFSPDGSRGYFVDTLARRILQAPIREGRLAEPLATFVQLNASEGYPDGVAIDMQGGVWCAHWDGGRVTRFDADGRATDTIALPVANVTKCAFGGEALDRLFITTARKDLDVAALAAQPLAGGVFEAETRYRGVSAARYRDDARGAASIRTCVFETS